MKVLPVVVFSFLFSFLLNFLNPVNVWGDTFTFNADRMTGGKATGKEVTVLYGNAEVRSDSLLLKADRIQLYGKNNNFIECSGSL